MHKFMVVVVAVAVFGSSCGAPCQDFFTSPENEASLVATLGIGYAVDLVLGSGEGELDVSGALPPGLQLVLSDGKIRVVGTPTTEGEFQANLSPKKEACSHEGKNYLGITASLKVKPAACDDALVCRVLGHGSCTQSSTCVPSAGYTSAACIPAVGTTGVCVDVNGALDQCTGTVAAMNVTTVEGAQVGTCVATPALVGCNHHVCFGAP